MPFRPINALGKAAVIASGLFWGLYRSLSVSKSTDANSRSEEFRELDLRLARIEATLAGLTVSHPPIGEERAASSDDTLITREELAEALEITRSRIEERVAEQFERQSLAIASLRALVTDTDVLLERVLDRLESMAPEQENPDSEQHGPSERATAGSGRASSAIREQDDRILSLREPVRISAG